MRLSTLGVARGTVLAAGCLAVGVMAQAPAAPAGVPSLSGIYNGRRCVPGNSDVCPEMNVKGGERLLIGPWD